MQKLHFLFLFDVIEKDGGDETYALENRLQSSEQKDELKWDYDGPLSESIRPVMSRSEWDALSSALNPRAILPPPANS